MVQLIRSIPRRVVNIRGVGTTILIPYATSKKAREATYTVWSGEARR